MFRVVSMVFQGLKWAWRRRILPILLGFFIALFGFDRLIFLITEAQWFASLGFSGLFWNRIGAQALLFSGFSLVALVLTGAFLPSVTRSASNAPVLRGQLSQFEPLRRRVSRLAWSVLALAALILAHGFARHWSDWLLLRDGTRAWGASGSSFGLPREVWTHILPVFVPFLGALWIFSLGLWLVVAATGILRALPLLAARAPAPPLVLPRALWRLGAFILTLGALRNAVHLLDLSRGRALETGDLVVSAPIFALGALACAVLPIMAWRRSTARAAMQKWSRLGISIAASLILPGLFNWFSAPLRALLPDTPWIAEERQNATRAAWHLVGAEMTPLVSPRIEAAWPVWDEKTLLNAQRGARFRGKRVVEWQSATLSYDTKWRAYIAGVGAGATTWAAGRDADESTRLEFERLDFSAQSGAPKATPLKTESAFFGFEGRSLFGHDVGVPIASMWAKWAWAWRLRDVLLPLDGASATRLLVWRGARERAEKLVPWLIAGGEPRLVFEGENPVWLLDLNAADANFPGALSVPDGELRGQNEAGESVTMRLDAHSGAVSFFESPELGTAAATRGLPISRDIPAASRAQRGVSAALLRAQVALEMAVRTGDLSFTTPVYGPLHSYETNRGAVSRALAVREHEWLSLETAGAAPVERVFRRVEEDFDGKVASLDAQLQQEAPPQNEELQLGERFSWPDISAPGGWWLARASFAAPRVEGSLQGVTGHGLRLWRVALTGALPGSRIEVASSAREARTRFLPDGGRALTAPRVAPPVVPAPKPMPQTRLLSPSKSSLEAQALQSHRASQEAAKRGDWTAFAQQSARLQTILERMSAQRRKSPR